MEKRRKNGREKQEKKGKQKFKTTLILGKVNWRVAKDQILKNLEKHNTNTLIFSLQQPLGLKKKKW